ncbi:MAG: TIGR03560 family F420-dependent LLM class oxidoreductase [Acidimicrobiales bacterium]
MQFSVWPGPQQPWPDLVEVARHAELMGWGRLYVADHFMSNDADADGATLECWSVVAALAAAVPRVGIGTLVCGNTYRHPAVLANQAATADIISGGRIVLGLGAGWQVNEHDKYGIDLYDLRTRMDRFEEACQVVRALRDDDRASFSGEHYQLTDAPMNPKPVGPMPLLIGGGGEKRTLRIAARHAEEWNVWSEPDQFAHKVSVLEGHCADVGRDPASIHKSTQALLFLSDDEAYLDKMRDRDLPVKAMIGTPPQLTEIVAAYRDAGVDELIIPDFNLGSGQQRVEILDRFMTEVAGNFERDAPAA